MLIRFKINEIECEVDEEKEDLTILQACTANGIEIPRFCYHEKLTIAGNCRMCLVYVTNEEKLLAACGIPLDENFDDESIETEIDEILKAREGVMEFLLINHPLDCPICDQGGECDLQEQTIAYGLDTGRFYIKKRAVEVKAFGRLIKGIMTRCIHCTRCVRFLTEIAGVNELGVLGRGYNMEIGTYKKNVIIESELSGNIIDLCPVGALTSAVYAYKGRPWELKNIKGIDIFDTVLTPINYQVKGGEIFRILPRINDRLNEEWITDKVRFHYESYKIIEKMRKDTPSYKIQANKFIELSWKTALKMVFKVLLNKKNKVDLIIGSKINSTNLRIYKELMNRLGSKNYITENGLLFKKFNYDFRENYINSNDLYNVDQNDLVLLCGINLRVESPLLNIKLRNINFGDDEIETRKKIGIIGNKFDWKQESEYLGSTVNSMLKVFEGRFPYCQQIKKSKAPLILVGSSLLSRIAISLQEIRAAFEIASNIKPENVLLITQGANFGMALEEGIFKENFSKGGNVLYSIDSNEYKVSKTINYIIYQGILNDTFENKIDLYLPSKHYFEDFESDREIYVNTFGQRSEIEKLRISKGNKIKENSMIGYIQLMYLNKKEMNRKEKEQKEIKITYRGIKQKEKRQVKINKNLTINNIIDNYYMTDINSRLSKNLMITGQLRKEKKIMEAGSWKNKTCI
uniref:NADH-ubiquinone oxidoreductase 75 kDa subunit n=1 Tax=Dictyostelium citrinum TaxID=361072 RepID=NDUS1_DICCI|nr:NADH dehydrogenase subunit 11 [Dictyostelium citrinum]Q2LCP5.2 RecName: Full=NADH-ubiquinone oxidoreductase 75 kDa subunit; AltName: Full=Complex I-75kD; Short=CI-75kD [Dictyostelium citrinum]ABC60398.4 NADH dehydrogenase subunit 11 [Dictyostelium citrinum]